MAGIDLFKSIRLCFSNCAYRALTCARTAIDAECLVNYELTITHADSANGALSFA